MQIIVTHPDQQFSGDIVGVRFEGGTATIDSVSQSAAYGYFQRAGYSLVTADEPPVELAGFEPDTDGTPDTTEPDAETGTTASKSRKGSQS
ncbi:hypothetical protein ACFC1T_16935 [Kitasatospora sp. NPDC056076]|uniref:hypothetical protein n=1 Tax=Kitasatospora sp. NPDC056076 TaxID=3345703 RepID=UPI0035DDF3CF